MASFADIQNRTYDLCDADSTSFPAARLTRALSPAMNRLFAKILILNGWEVDDANYTDLPIAKTTITSGQQDYSLGTPHLLIRRVEFKDSSGNFYLLDPIDESELKRDNKFPLAVGESPRTGAYKATTGIPKEYDLIGSSIFLYPIPNFTQASSLFVYFSRGPLLFDYTTGKFTDGTGSTSSVPGFNSLFHDLLAQYMAEEFCNLYKPEKVAGILTMIIRSEAGLEEVYGRRQIDRRGRLSPTRDSNK